MGTRRVPSVDPWQAVRQRHRVAKGGCPGGQSRRQPRRPAQAASPGSHPRRPVQAAVDGRTRATSFASDERPRREGSPGGAASGRRRRFGRCHRTSGPQAHPRPDVSARSTWIRSAVPTEGHASVEGPAGREAGGADRRSRFGRGARGARGPWSRSSRFGRGARGARGPRSRSSRFGRGARGARGPRARSSRFGRGARGALSPRRSSRRPDVTPRPSRSPSCLSRARRWRPRGRP